MVAASQYLGDLKQIAYVGYALREIGSVPIGAHDQGVLSAQRPKILDVVAYVPGGCRLQGSIRRGSEMSGAETDAYDAAQVADRLEMAVTEIAAVRVDGNASECEAIKGFRYSSAMGMRSSTVCSEA